MSQAAGGAGSTLHAGGAATSGSGGASNLGPASMLDGLRWELTCGQKQEDDQVCDNFPANSTTCPGAGFVMTDTTVVFGGTLGITYDVQLQLRGVLEPRIYAGGTSNGQHLRTGGTAPDSDYNVYSLEISSPHQIYYLNDDEGMGQNHYVFPINHMIDAKIDGGATVHLYGFDSNCSSIRNCIDSSVQPCTPYIVEGVPPAPAAWDGQFAQMNVLAVSP